MFDTIAYIRWIGYTDLDRKYRSKRNNTNKKETTTSNCCGQPISVEKSIGKSSSPIYCIKDYILIKIDDVIHIE